MGPYSAVIMRAVKERKEFRDYECGETGVASATSLLGAVV
jgi:hypothetical protein